eukprot:7433865-Prorocentrum_lima.AAC.1
MLRWRRGSRVLRRRWRPPLLRRPGPVERLLPLLAGGPPRSSLVEQLSCCSGGWRASADVRVLPTLLPAVR